MRGREEVFIVLESWLSCHSNHLSDCRCITSHGFLTWYFEWQGRTVTRRCGPRWQGPTELLTRSSILPFQAAHRFYNNFLCLPTCATTSWNQMSSKPSVLTALRWSRSLPLAVSLFGVKQVHHNSLCSPPFWYMFLQIYPEWHLYKNNSMGVGWESAGLANCYRGAVRTT